MPETGHSVLRVQITRGQGKHVATKHIQPFISDLLGSLRPTEMFFFFFHLRTMRIGKYKARSAAWAREIHSALISILPREDNNEKGERLGLHCRASDSSSLEPKEGALWL